MKITGFRLLASQHDWGRPIGDANGFLESGITEVPIVLLDTDEGYTGIGLGSHAGVAALFTAIEGEDPRAVTSLYDRMLAHVFKTGHAGATFAGIGALDMALWDLKAKLNDEPLWRTLGGRDRFVPGYASGLEIALSDQSLAEHYAMWADRGFRAGKLKGGLDVEADRRRLAIITDALMVNSTSPALMLDANESWHAKQAIRYVSSLEVDTDLTWIEEPVRRWDAEGLSTVSRGVRASVASGENLTGLEQYRPLLARGSVDIVQAGSNWGITHFLRVATIAHLHDLPVSPVGYNCNPIAHAATAVPNHFVTEVQDTGFPRGVTVDQTIQDGGIVLGDEPGLGIVIDEAILDAPATDGWSASQGPHVRPRRAGLRLVPEDATW
jgi:L-alanine-DL-glutamate epimerase-like enolase superfamily enzyme